MGCRVMVADVTYKAPQHFEESTRRRSTPPPDSQKSRLSRHGISITLIPKACFSVREQWMRTAVCQIVRGMRMAEGRR